MNRKIYKAVFLIRIQGGETIRYHTVINIHPSHTPEHAAYEYMQATRNMYNGIDGGVESLEKLPTAAKTRQGWSSKTYT